MKRSAHWLAAAGFCSIGFASCGDDNADNGSTAIPACEYDSGVETEVCASASYVEDVSACAPATTDYRPRDGVPGANGWPACISDNNKYHLIKDSIPSAAARSVAFESMGTKLWKKPCAPTKAEFLSARDDYSVAEGIASRVARRQDISYPAVPGDDKVACASAGIPDLYPDRCAGPAKLKPLIDDAFEKGINGELPMVQAARIEAALLWFFHLSLGSEVWTCGFDNIGDCDSAVGYYTQVSARDAPTGLARYVALLGRETHDRIYDGLLAARCWRDVDQDTPAVSATNLYDLAQAQINTAALRGQALVLRERIGKILCTTDEAQLANIEFVKTLGGFIDHGASAFDPVNAATLKAFTSQPTASVAAVDAAQAAIDTIFACP
jgi:hypothetical protein